MRSGSGSRTERVVGSVPRVPAPRWPRPAQIVPQREAELSAESLALLRQITESASSPSASSSADGAAEPSSPSASPSADGAAEPSSAAALQEGWRALARRLLARLAVAQPTEAQVAALAHQLGPYYALADSAVADAIAQDLEGAEQQLAEATAQFTALELDALAAHLEAIAPALMAEL